MEPIESNRVRMLTIEWEMMDKNRFVGLSVVNSLALRVVLYPLTVIKTRLQVFNNSFIPKNIIDLLINIKFVINLKVQRRGQVYKGIDYELIYDYISILICFLKIECYEKHVIIKVLAYN